MYVNLYAVCPTNICTKTPSRHDGERSPFQTEFCRPDFVAQPSTSWGPAHHVYVLHWSPWMNPLVNSLFLSRCPQSQITLVTILKLSIWQPAHNLVFTGKLTIALWGNHWERCRQELSTCFTFRVHAASLSLLTDCSVFSAEHGECRTQSLHNSRMVLVYLRRLST